MLYNSSQHECSRFVEQGPPVWPVIALRTADLSGVLW